MGTMGTTLGGSGLETAVLSMEGTRASGAAEGAAASVAEPRRGRGAACGRQGRQECVRAQGTRNLSCGGHLLRLRLLEPGKGREAAKRLRQGSGNVKRGVASAGDTARGPNTWMRAAGQRLALGGLLLQGARRGQPGLWTSGRAAGRGCAARRRPGGAWQQHLVWAPAVDGHGRGGDQLLAVAAHAGCRLGRLQQQPLGTPRRRASGRLLFLDPRSACGCSRGGAGIARVAHGYCVLVHGNALGGGPGGRAAHHLRCRAGPRLLGGEERP